MVHWLIWCVAWQSLIRIPCMVGWLTTWPTRKVIVLEAAQIKPKQVASEDGIYQSIPMQIKHLLRSIYAQ